MKGHPSLAPAGLGGQEAAGQSRGGQAPELSMAKAARHTQEAVKGLD